LIAGLLWAIAGVVIAAVARLRPEACRNCRRFMIGSHLREHDRLIANAARNKVDWYIDTWNARPPWAQLAGFRRTLLQLAMNTTPIAALPEGAATFQIQVQSIRTATLLMASILADRPLGATLSFQRISHAAFGGCAPPFRRRRAPRLTPSASLPCAPDFQMGSHHARSWEALVAYRMAGRNVAELQLQLQTITGEEPNISLARVVEHAKLKARQDKEYSDLKQRHAAGPDARRANHCMLTNFNTPT
jgi:hypothetical protein